MSNRLKVLACSLALLVATSGAATTYAPVTMKCPVGGEKFDHHDMMSDTTWGQLPDGTTLGAAQSYPVRLAQCPKNGLVLYREYKRPELASLSTLINSPEYAELRARELPYYRAYWLARKLGDPDVVWLLLAATQEAKNEKNDVLVARYQQEFVDAVGALAFDGKAKASIALAARRANALREMGQFAEAATALRSIVIDEDAGGTASDAAENRDGWRAFISQLAVVAARGDRSRAPIDMIGEREAVWQCAAPLMARTKDSSLPLGDFERQFCARPAIAKVVAEILEREKTQ